MTALREGGFSPCVLVMGAGAMTGLALAASIARTPRLAAGRPERPAP